MNANVHVWYDNELVNHNWRYDLTKVSRYDRIDVIELPDGWTLGESVSGETFAYDTLGDPYKVIHFGSGNDPLDGHYALARVFSDKPFEISVKTIEIGETVR